MASVNVINSFRVLLAGLLENKLTWNDEELDEMIHYLSTRDIPNIRLLEEEVSENLIFLVDTMREENHKSVEDLLLFFDANTAQVLEFVRQDIQEISSKSAYCESASVWLILDTCNLPRFNTPLQISHVPLLASIHAAVSCYQGACDLGKAQRRHSKSTVSADGEFYFDEPAWS